jgi:uncharacterized protein (DUF1501 family)
MNEHDCQACGEYYELSRRGFMKFSGATLLALGAPAWLPRIAMARDEDSTRDVLVSIYLRGGADGLTLCVPMATPRTTRSAVMARRSRRLMGRT